MNVRFGSITRVKSRTLQKYDLLNHTQNIRKQDLVSYEINKKPL